MGLISSACLIFLGVMAKYSTSTDGWNSVKKHSNYLIIGGLLLLVIGLLRLL